MSQNKSELPPPFTQKPPPQPSPRRHRSLVIAIAIISLLVGSGAFAYGLYLSNVLTLGPYETSSKPIQISQVTVQDGSACSNNNATFESYYTSPQQLPLGSGFILQSVWYKTGIMLQAQYGSSFNVIEHYNLTYTGSAAPSAGDLMMVYCDQATSQWTTLHPTYDPVTKSWSGTVTPTGFVLPNPYESTTPVMLTALQPGNYTCELWFTQYP